MAESIRLQLRVTYCEGWDPVGKAAAGIIPAALARARDGAGRPYAVLIGVDATPLAMILVHRQAGYLGVVIFDPQQRRVCEYDYRQIDDDTLHLRRFTAWAHASDDEPEFQAAATFEVTIESDGRARRILESSGSFHTRCTVPAEYCRRPLLIFGEWPFDAGCLTPPTEFDFADAPDPVSYSHATPEPPLWSAPAGLRPRHLEALFTEGALLADKHHGRTAQIRAPKLAGMLELPTGRVIAADPYTLDAERTQPFTVTVPPGTYAQLVAQMRWQGWEFGEVPAAKVSISEKETVTWELAVLPGQDPRLLGVGEFYGFGVDTGTGAFLDASGIGSLAEAAERHSGDFTGEGEGEVDFPELRDDATRSNLFMYPSGMGDGSYPVWIGRDTDGEVTCLVADMLILNDADPVPPTPESETSFILPAPIRTPETGEQISAALPSAVGKFFLELFAETTQMQQRVATRFNPLI